LGSNSAGAAREAFDVLIVGAGPAGSATALALLKAGTARVALIEKTAFSMPRVGESLSPGARDLLARIGALEALRDEAHPTAYGTAATWGSGEFATRDFMLMPFGHGRRLDRRLFDHDLALTARRAGAALLLETRLGTAVRRNEGWTAVLRSAAGEKTVAARWIVDATGQSAVVAGRLGARRRVFDRLVALWATFPAPRDAEGRSMVEAGPFGWTYSVAAPAQDGTGDLVWWVALMGDADVVREEGLNAPARWWAEVMRGPGVRERLDAARSPRRVRAASARSAFLATPYGAGWVAVGDAAASHDPLSSSGIARALDSGIRIGAALAAGANPGEAFDPDRRAAFGRYMATRSGYYQIEQRWPDSAFWRRRQTSVTLDPAAVLTPVEGARGVGWPSDLAPVRPEDLLGSCPARAADIVAALGKRHDWEAGKIILGLQWLMQSGRLAVVKSPLGADR
jgi:flavin-dependent dehydrogenase